MRFRSDDAGLTVRAVTGTHAALLALDLAPAARPGLLGFAVHRRRASASSGDWLSNKRHALPQYPGEALASVQSLPFETTDAALMEARHHPHQTLLISDDDLEAGQEYVYAVLPVYSPSSKPPQGDVVQVRVQTESLVGADGSEVHFNRGTAGSQEYAELMGGKGLGDRTAGPPGWRWLSRGLEEALLRFLAGAVDGGWAVRACLYEFQYVPVLLAFKEAKARGADVKIVVDLKGTTYAPAKRSVISNGPHLLNSAAIAHAGIADLCLPRTSPPTAICHHKFILLIQDHRPVRVWTGSTNLTSGGLFGHSNVGHVVTDPAVLAGFLRCWEKLAADPPLGDMVDWNRAHHPVPPVPDPAPLPSPLPVPVPPSTATEPVVDALAASMEAALDLHENPPSNTGLSGVSHTRAVEALLEPKESALSSTTETTQRVRPSIPLEPTVQLVMMPQGDVGFLDYCAALIRGATSGVFMTLPFGLNKTYLLESIKSATPELVPRLLLFETAGQRKEEKAITAELQALPHCAVAVGSALLPNQVMGYAKEALTGLNEHVHYIHTKCLLVDPLTNHPRVVTGSANFSQASCEKHDENILIVSGDKRTADIYVTEFMRMFLHHEWRNRMDAEFKRLNGAYLYYEQTATVRELLKFEPHPQLTYGRRLTAPEVWALKAVSSDLVADNSWTQPWFAEGAQQCLLRQMFAGGEGFLPG